MEILKIILKDIVNKSKIQNDLFKRNLLKEYLQIVVLDFIYSHPRYSRLIFYGGSCLAHCFGLPRLSEDLDFVDAKKNIDISGLAYDLEKYFRNETDLLPKIVVQKFRIYLKFPVLSDLGLAAPNESDWLFVKVEIFKDFDFCKNYKTQILPLFKYNRSILINTFDLPTLMATKIRAILYRKWEKTDKKGKTLIKVKGRDYFDLMWYLEKSVKPNLNCLENIKDIKGLKRKLFDIVDKADERSIRLDLEGLIDDTNFVKNISKNMIDILKRDIEQKL